MTWKGEGRRHGLAAKGISTTENKERTNKTYDRPIAMTAVMTDDYDKPYGIGIAEQDRSGYAPMYKGDLWFKTYEEAVKYADERNESMGLTKKEAWEIVASSMRKT